MPDLADADLGAILVELERRRLEAERRSPLMLQRAREQLVAAFGEADFAVATEGISAYEPQKP